MKRLLARLAITLTIGAASHAAPAEIKPTEAKRTQVKGHVMGESVAAFLRLEPETERAAGICRQNPDGPGCARLLAALDHGQRAEISNSSLMEFTFDGGKLVKLTMVVDGVQDAAVANLTKQLGPHTRESKIHSQNTSGAKWENHLFTWAAPDAYVTLYQDNDPSLKDRRPVLMVESRSDHGRKFTISTEELAKSQVATNPIAGD